MAANSIELHRKDAEVYTGHEPCMQKLQELLREINIPTTLLPLVDIQEFGYNKSAKFMWVTQKNPIQHKFPKMKRVVSYDKHVTAFVEENKLKKLSGVKTKELLIWLTLCDIYLDDSSSDKVNIANPSGITKSILISDFDEEDEKK